MTSAEAIRSAHDAVSARAATAWRMMRACPKGSKAYDRYAAEFAAFTISGHEITRAIRAVGQPTTKGQ